MPFGCPWARFRVALLVVLVAVLASACATTPGAGGDDDAPGDGDGGPSGGDGGSPDAFVDPLRGWQRLGLPIDARATLDGISPSLAFTAGGEPIVAFSEGGQIFVYEYTGTTWRALGDAQSDGEGTPGAGMPDLVAAGGALTLAWGEYDGVAVGTAWHVRRWNGTAWQPLPGTPLHEPALVTPWQSLAVGPDGKLIYVTTRETTRTGGGTRLGLTIRRFDGSAWTTAGFDDEAQNDALAPQVAIGGGKTFLQWEGSGVSVREIVGGGALTQVGGATLANPEGYSSASTSAVAVTASGVPLVAYHAYRGGDDGTNGFVSAFVGGAWQTWGSELQAFAGRVNNNATYVTMSDVAAVGEDAAIVWTEQDAAGIYGVYVRRCNATGCAAVGRGRLTVTTGAAPIDGSASMPRIAADPHGRLVVAWSEDDGSGDRTIHVWRYHGDPDSQ